MSGIKTVYGGFAINSKSPYATAKGLEQLFAILEKYNVNTIDTAQVYETSEELLGKAKAGDRFIIDTKAPGGLKPGSGTKDGIIEDVKQSQQKLGMEKVDIFYLHAPDDSVPLPETLAGINAAHKSGAFLRFGLSNYKAADVEAVHAHCKTHNYILPTVYQGNYSPVARLQETLLFPTLRRLNISFYAYSPLAGGFLTKTKQQIQNGGTGAGRFDRSDSNRLGTMYVNMYAKPTYLEALAQWHDIAAQARCSSADLAYRWVKYNSVLKQQNGDAVIVGARTDEQLVSTLEGLDAGPLDQGTVAKIDELWEGIRHEAPLDNYHDTVGK